MNLVSTSRFVAKSGVFFNRNSDWIIDFGATDHMICDRNNFSHFSSKCLKNSISNANGVSSYVDGVGTISLSPMLTIRDVLYVPSLYCNLLSVEKLTKTHNCYALFSNTHCSFQNIHIKETIGSGKKVGGLYYLEDKSWYSGGERQQASLVKDDFINKREHVWLCHKRLGHPSFSYLRKLFLSLFTRFDFSDFHCETCVMAKSHRTTFHLSDNKEKFSIFVSSFRCLGASTNYYS